MSKELPVKKTKSLKAVRIIVTVLASIFLLLSLLIFIGFLLIISSLINPVSILLPILGLILINGGLVLMIVAVWRKGKLVNNLFWLSIILIGASILLFIVSALTNQQLINSTISDDFKNTKHNNSGFVQYDIPTNWATKTSDGNTYFYPSRKVDDVSLGMVMVRSDFSGYSLVGDVKSIKQTTKDYVEISDTEGKIGNADIRKLDFHSTIEGGKYTTEIYVIPRNLYTTTLSFVFEGDSLPTYFRDSASKIISSIPPERNY